VAAARQEKEGRSSFLKKEAKTFYSLAWVADVHVDRVRQGAKVFCFFFSKKKTFFTSAIG
jgi:hypothetical protein